MERSDSPDAYSVALMTLLMAPIFDFHKVTIVLTAPLAIPTLSLVFIFHSKPLEILHHVIQI